MAVEDQSLWFSSSKEQSQETPLAPLALMEKPSDSTVKGHVKTGDTHHDHDVNSRIGRSAFNMFPTLQSPINKRALGQASRYMNANARKQKEQDIGGKGVMKSQVSSANGPYCGSKSRKTEAVDEAGTIAESTALLSMDIPRRRHLRSLASSLRRSICLNSRKKIQSNFGPSSKQNQFEKELLFTRSIASKHLGSTLRNLRSKRAGIGTYRTIMAA